MSTATRLERAHTVAGAEACAPSQRSERQVATQLGCARTTLRRWKQREAEAVMAPAALATFLAHPEGVQWLHRVVLAAQFVITLRAGAGVRVVSEFLELSGLSAFVGASYGSQQALNVALEQAVVEVAGAQRAALAQGMAPREVTVCEDETFHPAICLVALEPVSNFIVLEQYAHDRTAETWTQALAAACEGLAITVIQGTSDEAKALCRHIEHDAQAHHSPDLFMFDKISCIGLAKTRLQHVVTAVAVNLIRLGKWLAGTPLASTRRSRFAALQGST
jgi:hypothetical protein